MQTTTYLLEDEENLEIAAADPGALDWRDWWACKGLPLPERARGEELAAMVSESDEDLMDRWLRNNDPCDAVYRSHRGCSLRLGTSAGTEEMWAHVRARHRVAFLERELNEDLTPVF